MKRLTSARELRCRAIMGLLFGQVENGEAEV